MISIVELVKDTEEIYVVIYCFILLWINIDYLREYKEIKKGLANISSEDELEINPEGLSVILLALVFNFFRRWLLYVLAVLITENIFIMSITLILFVASLYDSLFNNSLAKVKNSNIGLVLGVADTILLFSFVIYLLLLK